MKKAIAVTELVIILLAVGAGVGLLFFGKQTAERVGCKADVEICRSGFLFYKKIREDVYVLGKFAPPPRLDCVAVSTPNCEERELKTKNKKQTMHVIAENLRWCWYKTLGEKNTIGKDFGTITKILYLIPQTSTATAIATVTGARPNMDFCLVCSEFTPNVDISKEEWNEYLDTIRPPNSKETYAQLLKQSKNDVVKKHPSDWKKELKYKDIAFEKGKKYFVVSVNPAKTISEKTNFLYVSPEIYCGEDPDQQVHYQVV